MIQATNDQYASRMFWFASMQATTSAGLGGNSVVPSRWLIIGWMLDILTTPHPTWVQGAIGDMGNVPVVGSQVWKLGYQAERFRAFLMSEFVNWLKFEVELTRNPPLSPEAPDLSSPALPLRTSRTSLRIPAVLGVANEVPEVTW